MFKDKSVNPFITENPSYKLNNSPFLNLKKAIESMQYISHQQDYTEGNTFPILLILKPCMSNNFRLTYFLHSFVANIIIDQINALKCCYKLTKYKLAQKNALITRRSINNLIMQSHRILHVYSYNLSKQSTIKYMACRILCSVKKIEISKARNNSNGK